MCECVCVCVGVVECVGGEAAVCGCVRAKGLCVVLLVVSESYHVNASGLTGVKAKPLIVISCGICLGLKSPTVLTGCHLVYQFLVKERI